MNKLRYEFVKSKFEERGYELLEDTYVSNSKKMLVKKDGYLSYINYANFSYGKEPSFFRVTNNDFLKHNIKTLIYNNGGISEYISHKVITKSKRRRILVTLKCHCGNVYNKLLDDIKYNKKIECNNCVRIRRGKNSRISRQNNINLIESKGYTIINAPKDFRRNDFIEVYNEDGYRGKVSCRYIIANKNMEVFSTKTNKDNYIYNINHWCELNNIKSRAIGFADNQIWTRTGIKFICECGEEFETSITSFQNGKIRCDKCAKRLSRWAFVVKNFLDSQHIAYIQEFRINSCRDILPLPFDFCIKDSGKLIEVDGEGHEKPCHFNQIGYDDALKTFEITKKHDNIKNEYCKKWNIPLLRITVDDIKNNEYKNKIMQFIKD